MRAESHIGLGRKAKQFAEPTLAESRGQQRAGPGGRALPAALLVSIFSCALEPVRGSGQGPPREKLGPFKRQGNKKLTSQEASGEEGCQGNSASWLLSHHRRKKGPRCRTGVKSPSLFDADFSLFFPSKLITNWISVTNSHGVATVLPSL